MNKKFSDVQEGETFTHNGLEYQKIAAVKVSCCRSINAQEVSNANNRTYIQPTTEVETKE